MLMFSEAWEMLSFQRAPELCLRDAWQALYRRGQAHQALGAPAAAVPDLAAALTASPANEKPAIAEKLAAARKAAGLEDAADINDVEQIEQVTLAERLSVSAFTYDQGTCCKHSRCAHAEPAVSCDLCAGTAVFESLCVCKPSGHQAASMNSHCFAKCCMQVTGSAASSRPIITEVTDDKSASQRSNAAVGVPPAMPMPGLGGMDPATQMRHMAQMLRGNPAMLGMMEGMMANLSQEQLDSMVRLLVPGCRTAALFYIFTCIDFSSIQALQDPPHTVCSSP